MLLSTSRTRIAQPTALGAIRTVAQTAPVFPELEHKPLSRESLRQKRQQEEKLARKAAKKTLHEMRRGEQGQATKKPSRGLDGLNEIRNAVVGAVSPDFLSETSAAFHRHEARQEELDPLLDGEAAESMPELRVAPGSFVEIRRMGHARWGVLLGYEIDYDGIEVAKTLLSTGEALTHPPRDFQFAVANFASKELVQRAGLGLHADEKNARETQARITLGKSLRDMASRLERASRSVKRVANELYSRAKHPDGKTWGQISLSEGIAFVAGDSPPTLELTYAVHSHFMDNSLYYIADSFEHRLSNIFSVRPLEDVEMMQRVMGWVRHRDPVVDEFAAKARAIVEATKALRETTRQETPCRIEPNAQLGKLNDADYDIINFIRQYLRQRRELQLNPCVLALPVILSKVSPSYLPLLSHTAFGALEDLSYYAPWSNPVTQDVDLQLTEFTDTLESPLPYANQEPVTPPVSVKDDRISGAKTIDGLDNMRHDFGNLPVYVIDDISAEELDDGISIEPTTDGSDNVWLHVHIADPTSVLRPDDPVARDAARRAATAYFPECTYPMLPSTELSLDALSGNPGASINVLTFSMLIDPSGDLIKHDVRAAIVRRVMVTQYNSVTRALGGSLAEPYWPFGKPDTQLSKETRNEIPAGALPDFQLLHKVTQTMAKRRVSKTDSVLWSQPRAIISMDKQKVLSDHDPRPLPRMYRGFPRLEYSVDLGTMHNAEHTMELSRSIVAECMISAGRVASLFAQERGIPMIYRALARPTGRAVNKYQSLLAKRDPYQGTILYKDALVQQLAQVTAQPTLTPETHWQLGISAEEGYARVTSPLRRYLDMLCHWQLKAALHPKSLGVQPPFSQEALKALMVKQHLLEQARRRGGNTSVRVWALRYIQDLIANGGHEALSSLEGIVLTRPMNRANSVTFVTPIMITKLGLPANLTDFPIERPPPIGSTVKVEIQGIEMSYNPRLTVRPRRS